jgi:hypothetical protein
MNKSLRLTLLLAFVLVTSSCALEKTASQKDQITSEVPTVNTTTNPESLEPDTTNILPKDTDFSDSNERWTNYYLLPEKEFVYMAKKDRSEEYPMPDFGSWDEYSILKYMSNKCADSYTEPYGVIDQFFDTTEITGYPSALIFYACIPSAGSHIDRIFFINKDEVNNNVYAAKKIVDGEYFRFDDVKLKNDEIYFSIFEKSNPPFEKDKAKIYFDKGKPIMKFISAVDESTKEYIQKYGLIYDDTNYVRVSPDKKYSMKEFINLAKEENLVEYAKINYGSWDEYSVLKYMSNECVGYISKYNNPVRYGLMTNFFDTTQITGSQSAIIFYLCGSSTEDSETRIVFINKDESKNNVYTSKILFDYCNFDISAATLDKNEINFSVIEPRRASNKISDTMQVYFKKGVPIMKFTSSNDEYIKKYQNKYGSIFNKDIWCA